MLLTLQSSFLLPPFGYALMMVRGAVKPPAPFRAFVKALVPFLLAQWLLLMLVLLVPRLVHLDRQSRRQHIATPAKRFVGRRNRQAPQGHGAAAARNPAD